MKILFGLVSIFGSDLRLVLYQFTKCNVQIILQFVILFVARVSHSLNSYQQYELLIQSLKSKLQPGICGCLMAPATFGYQALH